VIVDNILLFVCVDDQTPPNWYKSVVFLLLPPNATSILQPIDMGVVRSLTARFRRIQLASLFAAFEKVVDSGGKEEFDVKKATHLSHCLDWLAAAWDEVPANLIRRCWAKAAVLPAPMNTVLEQDIDRPGPVAPEIEDLARLLTNTVLGAKRGVIEGFVDNKNLVKSCEALLAFDNDEEVVELDEDILWTQEI